MLIVVWKFYQSAWEWFNFTFLQLTQQGFLEFTAKRLAVISFNVLFSSSFIVLFSPVLSKWSSVSPYSQSLLVWIILWHHLCRQSNPTSKVNLRGNLGWSSGCKSYISFSIPTFRSCFAAHPQILLQQQKIGRTISGSFVFVLNLRFKVFLWDICTETGLKRVHWDILSRTHLILVLKSGAYDVFRGRKWRRRWRRLSIINFYLLI